MWHLRPSCSLLHCFLFLFLYTDGASLDMCKAKELEKSRWLVPAKSTLDLDIYVHRGLEYSPSRAFTDVILQLNLTEDDSYDLYKGENCSVVQEGFLMDNRLFGLLKGVSLWKSHHLNVFNDTVVGISTRLPYAVQAKVIEVNLIRLGAFVVGVLVFIFARRLVRNALFFYGSGCSFGLLASLLVIVFIVYRIAPKKMIGLPILIGGWSLSVYILHFAWKNLATIAVQYQNYLVAYFVTVMAVSLAVCYKRGPPSDSRSHDIAQWTLQAISLLVIYASSQVDEVSVGVIALLVFHQLTRSWLWSLLFRMFGFIWRKVVPPKRRLLTMEEYEKEGQETTKRELQRLREYCRSPEADVWKITSRVHDPRRLARFVDGREDHILEEEEDLYDEDSGNHNSDDGEDDPDSDQRDDLDHRYLEDDDAEEWESEEKYGRASRHRFAEYSNIRESSFRRSMPIPKDGSRLMELPSHSRSTYYNESPQRRNSARRPGSASPSRRNVSLSSRSFMNHESSFAQQYARRQEAVKPVQKRSAPSTSSNEFFSSDSEPDLQAEHLY